MTGQATTRTVERLPSLTGVRGVAALWVVFFHVIQMSWLFGLPLKLPAHRVAMAGYAGVDLFFVLSGFTLMHAHHDQFVRPTVRTCLRFYASRVFRVYPLNAAVLALIALALASDRGFAGFFALHHTAPLDGRSALATLSLTSVLFGNSDSWNGPVWSLSAEIVGYVAFPLLAVAANRLRSVPAGLILASTLIGAMFAFAARQGQFGGNDVSTAGALSRMGVQFTVGILLRRFRTLGVGEGFLPALAIVSLAMLTLCIFVSRLSGFMPLPLAILVFAVADQRGVVSRILSHRATVFLGAISFPVYLLHATALWALFFYLPHPGALAFNLALIAVIAGVLLASWIAHVTIERPSHRFARHFLGRARNHRDVGENRRARSEEVG